MNTQLAFIFPGQGSQSVGMLADLAHDHPSIKQTFMQASDTLGYDLWQLVQQGPEATLNQTEYTQPALLAAEYSLWCLWQQLSDTRPTLLAGHSLGEYTALVCAQSLTFADGLKIVATRGGLMQNALPAGEGIMAAIVGLEDAQIIDICRQAAQNQVVTAANFNAVGQVVIGGHAAAVQRAMQLAETAGAKLVKQLSMSVPSHCSLLQGAAIKLGESLQQLQIQAPQIPVINNVDVASYDEGELIKDALIRQLSSPVQWVRTIEAMLQRGITTVVECGPGKVLTGLAKRINRDLTTLCLGDKESLSKTLTQIG